MKMGKSIPDCTYEMVDPELTIISEKRDLRAAVDGSMEVLGQCLVGITNQVRSYEKKNIKQNRERKHLLDKYTEHPQREYCVLFSSSPLQRKGSGKSSKGHQRYGMASTQLSAEEV